MLHTRCYVLPRMRKWTRSMTCAASSIRSRKEQYSRSAQNFRSGGARGIRSRIPAACFLKHLFSESQNILKKTETFISIWRDNSFMLLAVNINLWNRKCYEATPSLDPAAGIRLLVHEERQVQRSNFPDCCAKKERSRRGRLFPGHTEG